MSQQEFDTYLSLLCRLLRIAPQQREQVAEEFRAHMEDRLDELLANGMDREAAIKLALEEFGDAAGLAAQIASISQGRRKRWIMRIGTVSVVGLAAAGLLAVALWPEGAQVKAPQVVAQSDEKPKEPDKPAKGEVAKSIEEKLAQRIDAEYAETPLKEVLDDLRERTGIQMYLNEKAIRNAVEEALGSPITISLKQVRVDMVLDLVLEQAGDDNLAYVERDGVLIISTSDALSGASEVKVYNCRDLLSMTSPMPGGGKMGGPGGTMPGGSGGSTPPGLKSSPAESERDPSIGQPGESGPKATPRTKGAPPAAGAAAPEIPKGIAPQFRGGGGGGGGGMGMGGGIGIGGGMGMGGGGVGGGGVPNTPRTEEEIAAQRLMDLITTAVKPDSWADLGGFGTISEYRGLIVINHNARTHKEVESVLKMLREAAGLPPGGPEGGLMGGPMPRGAKPGGGGFF
jgi:Protein interacting with poly(A)-binding protein